MTVQTPNVLELDHESTILLILEFVTLLTSLHTMTLVPRNLFVAFAATQKISTLLQLFVGPSLCHFHVARERQASLLEKHTTPTKQHKGDTHFLLPEPGWDIGERQEMVTLKGHSDIVMGMMVMSSLDNLVSASLDTSIRVWDTYTQKPVQTLQGHNKVRSPGKILGDKIFERTIAVRYPEITGMTLEWSIFAEC